MSIESALKNWASSPAGKKKIAEERSRALKEGRNWGVAGAGSGRISQKIAQQYAEEMIDSIIKHLPASLTHPVSITRASFEDPVIKLDKDTFCVSIQFKPDAVHRDSLQPDVKEWEDGIPNIVVHLSNGWSAHGAIRGNWHNVETLSRMKYDGDYFMREAVEAFNRSHPYAVADLSSKYKV